MERFFAFPVPRMTIGMMHMGCPALPHPTQAPPHPTQPAPRHPTQSPPPDRSLNPNAMEFVPSFRQIPEVAVTNIKTKAEATSTTTLIHPEKVAEAGDHAENGFLAQRQIFEYLSQLGDEQMPLEEVGVALLPGGQGLSMRFTTKQKTGQQGQQPPAPNESILQLDVGDPKKVANRPESVLVAQFLFRVNDLLREKYEDGGDIPVCPKCTLCSKRSYTELEIERQIEGIKAFESFTFTDSTRYQDLVSHKAFKELCRKLGLIVSRDQIHINRAGSEQSPAVSPPPPSAQPSEVTVSITETTTETETDMEAYAGDDESQSNGDELTPKGSDILELPTKYVRGKLYRYENSEGSQLVNQLTEADPQPPEPMMIDDKPHPVTPAKSLMATSMPSTFPRLYKSAKAKCSVRGAGTSGLQSGSQAHRPTPYSRAVAQAQAAQPTLTSMQRCRLTAGGGQFQAGGATVGAAARKHQAGSSLTAPTRKQNHQRATAPKSELRCQEAATMSGSMAGRQPRQGRQPNPVQKQSQSNHVFKAAKASNVQQQLGTAQRMIPRSTTTSLMRQSEVKRRMSLLRGESYSDMLFNEYLFK